MFVDITQQCFSSYHRMRWKKIYRKIFITTTLIWFIIILRFIFGNNCSTSKNDGINMEAWKHATKSLTKIKNETIKELITTGLTKYILPKLETTPPDVETLRQYVFFPLFSEFENESLFNVSIISTVLL